MTKRNINIKSVLIRQRFRFVNFFAVAPAVRQDVGPSGQNASSAATHFDFLVLFSGLSAFQRPAHPFPDNKLCSFSPNFRDKNLYFFL